MARRSHLLVPLLLLGAAPVPTPTTASAPSVDQLLAAQRAKAAELATQAAAQATARDMALTEQRLAAERIAAAARQQVADDAVAAAATRVAELAERSRRAEAELAARSEAFAPLLPLLERLSLYPAETLLASPLPPEQAVRGLLVLGGVSRQLRADAAALESERAELARLRQQLATEQASLGVVAADQARQAAALDAKIAAAAAARGDAQDQVSAAARQAAAAAARAGSLRAALVAIETARHAAETRAQAGRRATAVATATAPPAVVATDGWANPVSGRMVQAFGADTDAGPSNGVSFATPPGARVVSPCAGRVVFSGPFRSFGLLLIVDCGAATHVVLAGLDRLDSRVGQMVRAGEPVGVMAQWNPARGGSGRPSLYVELRRGGQAVNPAPLLHSSNEFALRLLQNA